MEPDMLRNRFWTLAGAIGVAFVLTASPASALPRLVFDQNTPGGTVSWAGGTSGLVGTDIRFEFVTGFETPANDGSVLSCIGGPCLLNFTTGDFLGVISGIPSWGPGGSFTLTGDLGGIGDVNPILTGTWISGVRLIPSVGFVGSGIDSKDPELATFYGIPPSWSFNYASTNINSSLVFTGAAFTASVTNADITNTVPEPGTLLLLGGGISALALRRRRKG
jgi:hypothetical protein